MEHRNRRMEWSGTHTGFSFMCGYYPLDSGVCKLVTKLIITNFYVCLSQLLWPLIWPFLLREGSFKKKCPYLGQCPNRGGSDRIPTSLTDLAKWQRTNCPNSKTKCPLQNNSIIMTTYDFSMKSVMCYLEWNERFLKKIC